MNAAALAELDRAFNAPDATMPVSVYNERRAALLAEPAPAPAKEMAVRAAIAKVYAAMGEMETPQALGWLAAKIASSDAMLDLQNQRWDAFRAGLGPTLRAMLQTSQSLSGRIAKLERAPASQGGGVTIRSEHVTVDGMEHVAGMMERLDTTLRSPVVPVYGQDGVLVGARRELPGDEPAARARKPHLKYSGGAWVEIDGFHRNRDAR